MILLHHTPGVYMCTASFRPTLFAVLNYCSNGQTGSSGKQRQQRIGLRLRLLPLLCRSEVTQTR